MSKFLFEVMVPLMLRSSDTIGTCPAGRTVCVLQPDPVVDGAEIVAEV